MFNAQLDDCLLRNPSLQSFEAEELNLSWQTLNNLFHEKPFEIRRHVLSIEQSYKSSLRYSISIDISSEVLPSLIYAHRYFGKSLPKNLTQKLLNPPQSADTIFELNCLGYFQGKYQVVYEPKLTSGKSPDFKILLPDALQIYVECKNQKTIHSKFSIKFDEICNKLSQEVDNSSFIREAWKNGLRTEISFSQEATKGDIEREIAYLSSRLKELELEQYNHQNRKVTSNIYITCVPRQTHLRSNSSIRRSSYRVSTSPTKLDHTNAQKTIYSWANLDKQIRTLQRKLLLEARLKLRGIPHNSLGMVCLQTYFATKFIPEVEKLMSQEDYSSLPFVWVNPFNESRVIYRNNFGELFNLIFQ